MGGVFGDPLLHVRLMNLKQNLLFDLGDPGRLTGKVAHQVRSVFLSHAHIDHISGFLWFLRSRIGHFGPCRIFGPAGTIRRIESFLNAVTWDRIEENAPVFEVSEIYGASLRRARLRAGGMSRALPEIPIENGIILKNGDYTVEAVVCDHNIPSVAYALAFQLDIKIRKERLAASGTQSGPWLGKLKACIAAGRLEADVVLPDGRSVTAGELSDDLAIVRPGKKLVYASDMADTPENRKRLTGLARSAHTLFCETGFMAADRERARITQHLTTVAAVDIARKAGVNRLVPFHFSKRYEHNPDSVFEEIISAAEPVRILGYRSGSKRNPEGK
jgi:ribonuclease Z